MCNQLELSLVVGFVKVSYHTWDFSSNMNPHSHAQSKTYVDAQVLSECSLSCHYLGNRPQAKHLHSQRSNNSQARSRVMITEKERLWV